MISVEMLRSPRRRDLAIGISGLVALGGGAVAILASERAKTTRAVKSETPIIIRDPSIALNEDGDYGHIDPEPPLQKR